jgi:hypothetical protein
LTHQLAVRRAQQGREREEDTQTQDRGHGSDRGDRRVRLRRSYDLGQRIRCTRGYKPCIPARSSDVDCYGGSGTGPRYTKPRVVYRVWGRDRYGLDADNDSRGCE